MDDATVDQPIALISGNVVPADRAGISVADTGFVHGAAVAEMIRTFQHRPFHVSAHLDRLWAGIEALRILAPPSGETLQNAITQVVEHNARLIPAHHDLGIIVFVTAGLNRTYLDPVAATSVPKCTWGVHSFPLPFELWSRKMDEGQQLVVPPTEAIPVTSLNPQMKWRSRVHWFLADQWVRENHPGAAAVLCDAAGFLTETSTANLMVVKDGQLLTPRKETTLNGISRNTTLELAEQIGIRWDWADLTPEDVLHADEVLVTSTPYCLMPVTTLNGNRIGNTANREFFKRLVAAWNDLVGLDIIQQIRTGASER
ncbi:MAG: aminotransferase class IV [Planctomycetaceae bacterium]